MCDFSPISLNYVADVPVVLKVTLLLGVSNCISLLIIYIYIFLCSNEGRHLCHTDQRIFGLLHMFTTKSKAKLTVKLPTKLKIHPERTAQLLVNIRNIFMFNVCTLCDLHKGL